MRSGKRRLQLILTAAWATATLNSAYASPPHIIYTFSLDQERFCPDLCGTVTFDVLGLVSGANSSMTDDGLVAAQFSIIQTSAGITGASLTFSLSGSTTGTTSYNTVFTGSIPPTVNGNIGTGVDSTGSPSDTILASANFAAGTVPRNDGTTSISGTAYNIFHIGTGTLSFPPQSFGSYTSLSIVPRAGAGDSIHPQQAYVDGVLSAFRGDDSSNVGEGSPLLIFPSPPLMGGDTNCDGFVDSIDFGILVNHYLSSTSNGYRDGDFDASGFVDSTDFGILVNNYISGPNPPADLEPSILATTVPEPASLLVLPASFILLKRRHRAR